MNIEQLKNKAAGCLVGLAVGDAFGDAARDADNNFLYGITTDFPEKPTGSTDDTEFALLTAEILLNANGSLTSDDVVKGWKKHVVIQDELRRGGASEREAAANIRKGIMPPLSGKYNSYSISDGAAMRTAPNGIIAAGDPDKAAELARIDAEISHYQDGVWGAQSVAAAVAVAMDSGSVNEIIEAAFRQAPEDSWFRSSLERTFQVLEESEFDLLRSWMPLHIETRCEYKAAVPEAVTAALAIFRLTEGDFRNGIIYSGNFGRDSDTIGAVVGALSGALHGIESIPADWVEKVRRPDGTCLQFTKGIDIIETAHKLAGLTNQG